MKRGAQKVKPEARAKRRKGGEETGTNTTVMRPGELAKKTCQRGRKLTCREKEGRTLRPEGRINGGGGGKDVPLVKVAKPRHGNGGP